MNILLVSDSQRLCESMDRAFRAERWKVTRVSSAEAASAVGCAEVSCCIVDLRLPDRRSFELIEQMRHLAQSSPLLVLSLSPRSEDCLRCFELGADGFMMQPVNPLELRARISSLVRREQATRDALRWNPLTSKKQKG